MSTQGTGGTGGDPRGFDQIKPWVNELAVTTWVEIIVVRPRAGQMPPLPVSLRGQLQCGTEPPPIQRACRLVRSFGLRRDVYDPVEVKNVRELVYKAGIRPAEFVLYRRLLPDGELREIDLLHPIGTRTVIMAVDRVITPDMLAQVNKFLAEHRGIMPARII